MSYCIVIDFTYNNHFACHQSSHRLYLRSLFPAIELVGPSRRALVGTWVAQAFALGYLVLVLLAYFLRSWKVLAGAIAALIAPCLGLIL